MKNPKSTAVVAAQQKSIKVAGDAAPEPDYVRIDESVGYLVRRTHRAFTRALEKRLDEHGLSISAWFFLRLLWEQDGLTQKELSEELGLTPPTTVVAMDNLDKQGLIKRLRSTEDRRKVHIYLTPRGRELKRKLLPYAAEVNQVAMHDVSMRELKILRSILERVNIALDRDVED